MAELTAEQREIVRRELLAELDNMIRSPKEDDFARLLIDRVLPEDDSDA